MEAFDLGEYEAAVKLVAGSTLQWDGANHSLDGELALSLADQHFTLIIENNSGRIYYLDPETGMETSQLVGFPVNDDFTLHKALLFCELVIREIALPIN